MTTLLSRGPGFRADFEQLLIDRMTNWRLAIEKELADRGLSLRPEDLANALEEISPNFSKAVLNTLLDFTRPLDQAIGLRIVRLSETQAEVILPAKLRNMREETFHEGLFSVAAIEAASVLLKRHAPLGKFDFQVQQIEQQIHQSTQNDVRLLVEWTESNRELILSDLRQNKVAFGQLPVHVVGKEEQRIADITLSVRLSWIPALDGSKESLWKS